MWDQRVVLHTMTQTDFQALADEVYDWSSENFGEEQPWDYPRMGVAEEFGELIHSVLKRFQGIRLNEEDVGREAEMDAVGDMVVYLLNTVRRYEEQENQNLSLSEIFDGLQDYSSDSELEAVANLGAEVGTLFEADAIYHIDVKYLILALSDFCSYRDYTLDECIEEAWGEVQHREWDSNLEEAHHE
jgi:hypothetical protein